MAGGGSELTAIRRDYRDWCEIGLLLAELFDGAALSIQERDGRQLAIGVALKAPGPASLVE